ncbi:histidine kinase [Acetivibrio ethanolgignens]|uniref:HAMP domain-containing protein n=1 Tax=Acetivibrio ethanolgignens TaxID=290052 RepID=A0A0V8QI88_9FIRM|nr:histidine kinase [Acetivibrio ethanolgignens]KSV60115.1 hypothetical protein ASU35_06825 [Acetivibrio ethanolgignens]
MKRYTLESKIKKIYFVGFVGIILISVLGFAVMSNSMYSEQAFTFCENTVSLNLNLLENRLMQIQEIQRSIAEDSRIKEIIKYHAVNEEIDYSIELYQQREVADRFSLLFRSEGIDNAYIVDARGECLYTYKASLYPGRLIEEEWFQEIMEKAYMSSSYISRVHDKSYLLNGSKETCISMVMPITLGADGVVFSPKAYLVCDVSPGQILESSSADIKFALLYAEEEWYSFEEIEGSEDIRKEIEEGDASVRKIRRKGDNDLLVVSMGTKNFGLQLIGVKELAEESQMQRNLILLAGITMGAAALLTLIVSKQTTAAIVRPVKRLIEKCNEVSAGNYEIEFEKEEIQELGVLSDTIQNMIDNVVSLNKKMVEEEKRFSQQRLRALQHQINPHFINNVLQSIKALALEGKMKEISDMATCLGKVMAYSVYQPYESVTVKEELEHIKNYLEVQNIRFENRIIYSVECSGQAGNAKILKLILQPLVENAIEHGLGLREREIITIDAVEEEDMVCIIISDNGKGISEEKILQIREKLASGEVYDQQKSIGILNVNERLINKYGKEYGLELFSKEGNQTTVIVKLPKEREENGEYEGIAGR